MTSQSAKGRAREIQKEPLRFPPPVRSLLEIFHVTWIKRVSSQRKLIFFTRWISISQYLPIWWNIIISNFLLITSGSPTHLGRGSDWQTGVAAGALGVTLLLSSGKSCGQCPQGSHAHPSGDGQVVSRDGPAGRAGHPHGRDEKTKRYWIKQARYHCQIWEGEWNKDHVGLMEDEGLF